MPKEKSFLAIVGREAFDPKEDENGVIHDFADDDATRIIDVLAQLIPAATRSQITQTYLWMRLAFMHMIASDARLRRLSAPERAGLTVDHRLTSMTAHVVGGWTALANQTVPNHKHAIVPPGQSSGVDVVRLTQNVAAR